MALYSEAELKDCWQCKDLEEALGKPDEVIRLEVYRHENAEGLARVVELRNLQELSISLANVSQLLPGLGELTDLQDLSLQACGIAAFPESILSLRNLRSLSIGNNSLCSLPDDIGGLVKLEELRFMQNELERIPESIGRLTRLNVLGLSHNKLGTLPDSIGELLQLEWLFLDANQLQNLSAAIGNLSRLRSLNLSYNKLRSLPDSVCDLQSLESLRIEHNPFDALPRCLARMASAKKLSIEAGKRRLFMDWGYQHSKKPPRLKLAELKLFVVPGSELYEPLLAAIREGKLSQASARIVGQARDSVKIETTAPDDYLQPGCSRFGGFPDLTAPSLFPTTDGRYWSFLAQLNLADLAPLNSYLPRSGVLSFFVDSTVSLGAKVHWHEGDPRGLITVRHGGADAMVDSQDDYTQKPHRVRFMRFFSAPQQPPDGISDDQDREAYEKCDRLHESVDHQINGHTFTQHESPQELAANKLGGLPDEWVPLLQLGWDAKVGFCFGDAGTLSFTLHREDLRRWDFSRVHLSLESS